MDIAVRGKGADVPVDFRPIGRHSGSLFSGSEELGLGNTRAKCLSIHVLVRSNEVNAAPYVAMESKPYSSFLLFQVVPPTFAMKNSSHETLVRIYALTPPLRRWEVKSYFNDELNSNLTQFSCESLETSTRLGHRHSRGSRQLFEVRAHSRKLLSFLRA